MGVTIDMNRFSAFAKKVDWAVKKAQLDAKNTKNDKQIAKAGKLVDGITSLGTLLTPAGQKLSKEDRDKKLREALAGLLGALTGTEDVDELNKQVQELVDAWNKPGTDEDRKKKLTDAVTALVKKVVVTPLPGGTKTTFNPMDGTTKTVTTDEADKETKAGAEELVELAAALLMLASGTMTQAQKDELLAEAAGKLLKSKLVVRQLQWFVTENFLLYAQAVKIGMELGKPFGDHVAKNLTVIVDTAKYQAALVALQAKDTDWVDHVATDHTTVHVRPTGGSLAGWSVQGRYDAATGQVVIEVISPAGQSQLFDTAGRPVLSPADAPAVVEPGRDPAEAAIDQAAGRVEIALRIAHTKPDVIAAKAAADTAKADYDAALSAESAAYQAHVRAVEDLRDAKYGTHPKKKAAIDDLAGKSDAARQALRAAEGRTTAASKARAAADEAWRTAVKVWLVYGAQFDTWGAAELQWLNQHHPEFTLTWDDINHGGVAVQAPGGKKFAIAFSPGRVAALVAVALLLGALGWSMRGDDEPDPAAVVAPAGSTSPTPSGAPSATRSATPSPARVSGPYAGTVAVTRDPAGHRCCVKPAMTWDVLQVRDRTTGKITITLSDVVEGIDLTSSLPGTGAEFTATGRGTVAGFAGTEVSFTGTVAPDLGVDGTLTVGGNGTLPTGRPIVFTVDLAKL